MRRANVKNPAGLLEGARQIGAYLGKSKDTAVRWIDEYGLPAFWVNGKLCSTTSAVDYWLNSQFRRIA